MEETGRLPGLIFGMLGIFLPWLGQIRGWNFFHTFDGAMT